MVKFNQFSITIENLNRDGLIEAKYEKKILIILKK